MGDAENRLKELETLFLNGPLRSGHQCFSIETLLDVLVVLYDESCNSSLRREKTVSDFIQFEVLLLGGFSLSDACFCVLI
ncbi:unnamed protein product [Allacma fusca]|uniref:Uncharacterized protein n=1 Tax=Allacma fusca TaxID=39272 RepID=A0A8J2KJH2_9HEXA|nr:unnamed protein product [Allacma fusca]